MLLRKISLALLLVVAVTGCNSEKFRNVIDQRSNEAYRGLQEAENQSTKAKKVYNPLVVSDKVWAGNAAMRLHRGTPLPEKFETPRGIALVNSQPMKLSEIISLISSQTGVPMRITANTEGSESRDSQSNKTPIEGMTLAYEGPLSGLLDQVCSYYGVNWKYDGASVNISRYETRVFVLETLPGTQKVKDGMKESSNSNSGSNSGSGGGSSNDLQQSSEMEVEFKVWEELDKTLTSILGGVGTVVTAPSSGTATVTTTPDIMRTVAKFIAEENKRLSRQVAVNVEIYNVTLAEGSDFQVTLDTVFKKIRDLSLTLDSPAAPNAITGAGVITAVLGNDGIKNNYISPILTALQSVGDATRVAQFPLTTLNNRPVTRRIGHEIAYLQSSETTTSTNVGSTTTMTPGTIHEGFSLQVTPRVLDDGRVMLQYSFSLVDKVSITTLTATGDTSSMVQLPETVARVFVQQSLLKSGSTLVIGGYDDEVTTHDSQGVANPFSYWLGGGYNGAKTRSMMFIAITPQVMDVPRAEQE